jgi:carbon starvation protein
MLLEGFVALIALATIMIVAPEVSRGAPPGRIYGDGLARFLTVIAGEGAFLFAATFGAMAFSTFVFDTLDVATRLGRYILEELSSRHGRTAAAIATAITAGVPAAILLASGPGGWRTFWTLFGTSNQLLAALTLLGVTVWLKRQGKRVWFTFAPMCFVMVITLWALAGQVMQFVAAAAHATSAPAAVAALSNAAVALLRFALAVFLLLEAWRVLYGPRGRAELPTASAG